MFAPIRWLESLSFPLQLLVLAAVFDPVGVALGYLLHPQLGVSPVLGAMIGLMGGATVVGAWVFRYSIMYG